MNLVAASAPSLRVVEDGAPDFERYPGFRAAMATAQVAEMEAVFYPAMWWHHVDALQARRLRAQVLNRLNR